MCSDAPNQAAANVCASDKFKQADAALNRAYQQLMARLAPGKQPYARDAQRAWLMFRDKECTSRTGGGPNQQGTIWPMLYMECQTALTLQRTQDLQQQVRCPGGDLACPGG